MVNKLSQGKIVIFEVFTNTKDILKTIDDELGFYIYFNPNNEDQINDLVNIINIASLEKYGFRFEKSKKIGLLFSYFAIFRNKKIENLNLK